jgi:putative ABC transport system permease protein
MDTFFQDVRFGLRMLRKNAGFTLVAVLTLALGIGANTAIFSLVNTVLLRPLPYPEPERLVLLRQSYAQRGLPFMPISQANYVTYREQTKSYEGLAAYTRTEFNLSGLAEPERISAAQVSANFFDVFGVQPVLGRVLRPGEDAPGRRQLALLSNGYWQRRFGGRPDVIGQTLVLNSVPTEIIGVMPAAFAFPERVQLWVPLDLDGQRRSPFNLLAIGRLKPGVMPQQAEMEATQILRSVVASDAGFIGSNAPPAANSDLRASVGPLREAITGRARTPLLVLLGAVGLVLLIACANVATLLLSRGAARAREISVRVALGATRTRIVRQLMTECFVLGVLGCAAGVALAVLAGPLVDLLPPGSLPRFTGFEIDGSVLLFAFATGLGALLLFGLAPAARIQRLGVHVSMQGGERSTATQSIRRTNSALVAVQFALSLMLLVGTGLLLRSFQRLMSVDPGFAADHVLTMQMFVHAEKDAGYRNPFAPPASEEERARLVRFYQDAVGRVRTVPGVQAAAIVSQVPLSGGGNMDGIIAEGHEPTGDGVASTHQIRAVGPGYFSTMKFQLLRGRDFDERDREGAQTVAIVDDTFARRYWPEGDALGRRIRYSWNTEPDAWMTIVGVVSGVREGSLASPMEPNVYLPYGQEPSRGMTLAVRTSTDPETATAAVQSAIREVNPGVPVYDVQTMDDVISATLFPQKFTGSLLATFAGIALALAAIGIYGVISLEVTGRAKELAIRMALGAEPRRVFAMVVRRGAMLAGVGLVIGIAGAVALTRLLADLLFGVTPLDAVTFASGALVLVFIALLGCSLPARRAAKVDPMIALRYE